MYMYSKMGYVHMYAGSKVPEMSAGHTCITFFITRQDLFLSGYYV